MDRYPWRFQPMLKAVTDIGAIRYLIRTMVAVGGSMIFVLFTQMPANAEQLVLPKKRDDISAGQLARVIKVTTPASQFTKAEAFESKSGGAATSLKHVNRDSFSHPSANLSFAERADFNLGNGLFRKLWASSPSSTQASDGLGPLFNARGCQSCHIKDGRGQPPEQGADANSMFLRLARKAATAEEKAAIDNHQRLNFPDPVYGEQLQNFAVPGLVAEGRMKIEYTELPVTLGDGSVIHLRKPAYSVEALGFGPLHRDTTLSPRVTPPMIGMGLIQAIHPADLNALADPDDLDGDGISGRLAIVRNRDDGGLTLGRFGWKAQNPTIRAQTALAFSGDIGISSPDVPNHYGDCTKKQLACLTLPHGEQTRLGASEAPDPVLDLVVFYSENLAVPARRDVDEHQVLAGKQLFYQLGCTGCHQPKFVTSNKAENKAHRFQLIWPYSDFLLHDMGEGLADGQRVGSASGREWRTPPLWGIGLTETVSGHTFFLHDGRARNLSEAILWHGGEARQSRDGFAALEQQSRQALLKFLESL